MPLQQFNADALLRALACSQVQCPCHRAVSRGHGLTHCPAHDDQHPSLSVSDKDGVVLWNCKAGCQQSVITAAIHALFPLPERPGHGVTRHQPLARGAARETVYDYGRARHIRLDFPDGTKRMWWEPPGTRMADLPLWNGDLLKEERFDGEPVLLVEGEKDANRGVMFGFCCVSLPGGASQRDFGTALGPLKNRDVVLVPDSDKQGKLLMMHVAVRLSEIGVSRIRVLYMLPSDHDLSDLLNKDADDDPRGARVLLKDMIENADVLR